MRRIGWRGVASGVLTSILVGLPGLAASQTFGFRTPQEAESAVAGIVAASGLPQNFEIVVDEGSNNAAALIVRVRPDGTLVFDPGEACRGCDPYRVITYDPALLLDLERRTGSEWGPISVMAHEVGHHLCFHTSLGTGSTPPTELEADFYSGFILNRMGASLEQALATMRILADPRGSSTHPPRRDRLVAITEGWRKAEEQGGAADDALRRELEEARQAAAEAAEAAERRVREAEAARTAAEARRTAEAAVADRRQAEAAAEAAARTAAAARRAFDDAKAELGRVTDEAVAQAMRVAERVAAENRRMMITLVVFLAPLVLAALLLGLRKPRREVVRVIESASERFRRRGAGALVRGTDGNVVPAAREAAGRGGPGDAAPGRAMPFDGSGLGRCDDEGGFVLGRDGGLVDAVLDGRSVSRRHARVKRRDGRLWVEDLNSTNGTHVNGERIEPFVPTAIARGDAVLLGDVPVPLWNP